VRVLIIGPSIERSKGGTSVVISEHLSNPTLQSLNDFKYLRSHVDGSLPEKFFRLLNCLIYILVKHKNFDLIHIHANSDISFYRKTIILRFCKLCNKKIILHIHGHDFDSFYRKNRQFLKKYIRNSLLKSNKVLVLSEYWKTFFDKEFPNVKTEIFQNGVDIKAYHYCIKKTNSLNKYLFLGRMGERKGVYDLIKAIAIIVNSLKRNNLIFYIAGDGEIENVNKMVNNLNLTNNIKVLGWLNKEEKKKILKECEVVVLPSYDENLPMSLIEAMSCGKIIISTFAGGIPDLVKQNINGFLFHAGDIQRLVDHILFVTDNPEKMKPISQNNINTITQHFNIETLSLKLNAIYNSV
jgi:glycosyltransferase involved in cell wall biosynthesis